MEPIIVFDFTHMCKEEPTNAEIADDAPTNVVHDIVVAADCLFCCCCTGSGSGSGTGTGTGTGTGGGSGSGSGSGAGACCPTGPTVNPPSIEVTVYPGFNYSDDFIICEDMLSTFDQALILVNGHDSNIQINGVSGVVWNANCSWSGDEGPTWLPDPKPVVAPGESYSEILTWSSLQKCCSYDCYYAVDISEVPLTMMGVAPTDRQVVDDGIDRTFGSSGIAGPGCLCKCETPIPPERVQKTLKPAIPAGEAGWTIGHEFINLPGEENCRYLWKLDIAWVGQGEGFIFARDRCNVLHVDKRLRNVFGDEETPPSEEFEYQLLVCGPTTLCMQLRNHVAANQVHAGHVIVGAQLLECMRGHNIECCCGPYPACTCDPSIAPKILCQAQKENLPADWKVDEAAGEIVVGGRSSALAGLAYTVDGDVTCAYKIQLELSIEASKECMPIFMGGDYVGLEIGEDGKGRLCADLWVCGGTIFTLLMTGAKGNASFKVKYAGECQIQTPVCCP